MTTLTVVVEATGKRVGSATFDGKRITADGAAVSIVNARRRSGKGDAKIWEQLDGWSNGYMTFTDSAKGAAVRAVVAAELQRLAGHDELHHYWTKGEGLAKWVHSAHPWTALYHHLVKHVPPEMAKRMASAWFHEVLGFWPGSPHVGAVRLPKAGRSALIQAVVAAELQRMLGEDDDPIGELDEDTLALLQAMDELDAEYSQHASRAANWDPAKHPKGPDGRFLSVVDRIKQAIADHKPGDKHHPFESFNREQLRKAAKTRGIPLKRGEDRDSIAAKLLADLAPDTKGANRFDDDYFERPMTNREYRIADLKSKLATVKADQAYSIKSWEDAIRREGENGDPRTLAWYRSNLEAARNRPALLRQELADVRKSKHHPDLEKPHLSAKTRTGTPSIARAASHLRDTIADDVPAADRIAIGKEFERQAALTPKTAMRLEKTRIAGRGEEIGFGGDPLAEYTAFYEIVYAERWRSQRTRVETSCDHSLNSGWWSRYGGTDNIGSITAHEFGHHVDRAIGRDPRIAKRLALAIEAEFTFPVNRRATDFRAEIQRFVEQNPSLVRHDISQYASKNANEMFAEIWHEWSTLGEKARPKIRRLGTLMQELAEQGAFQ